MKNSPVHHAKKVATSLILAIVLGADHHAVDANRQFGDACTVRYGPSNNKYFETGGGNDRCDTNLVCITEVDDGRGQVDFPGTCELKKCFGNANGGGNQDDPNVKVTICHRTCSETNPWVRITVDESAYSDYNCKHGQHSVDNCNGKDLSIWGDHQSDYLIRRHGTKAEIAASLGFSNGLITDYWNHWESACPYVRNGACCSFDHETFGYTCCGAAGDPDPPVLTFAPTGPEGYIPTTPAPVPAPIPILTTPAPVRAPPTTPAPVPAPPTTPAPVPAAASPTTPAPVFTGSSPTTSAPVDEEQEVDACRRRRQLFDLQELWNITEPSFEYSDLTFTLDFPISDSINDQGQIRYQLFDMFCNTPYTGLGLNGEILPIYDDITGDDRLNAPVTIKINSNEIARDEQVYSEDVPPSGQVTADINFCMRFSVHTPPTAGEDIEVNFMEVIVMLDVDLSDGFQIGNITVAPFDRCQFEAQESFEVEGYFCKNGDEDVPQVIDVLNQGQLVKVCVRPKQAARDSFIRMRNIRNFTFTGEDGLEQPAIVNYQASPNGLTELWCEPGYAICHFETVLFAAFFAKQGIVSGYGSADMQFGGNPSETSVTPKRPGGAGPASRRGLLRQQALQDDSDAEYYTKKIVATMDKFSSSSSYTSRSLQTQDDPLDRANGDFGFQFKVQGVDDELGSSDGGTIFSVTSFIASAIFGGITMFCAAL